jgi:hypothetical protein
MAATLGVNPLQKSLRNTILTLTPILEPLIRGGPVALVEKFNLPHGEVYADACHLCYEARQMLRSKHPEILTPDQMYGKLEE